MFYQQLTDNAWYSAHAKLDCGAVDDLFCQQSGNGLIFFGHDSRRKLRDFIFIILNDVVNLREINDLVMAAKDPGHMLVDL